MNERSWTHSTLILSRIFESGAFRCAPVGMRLKRMRPAANGTNEFNYIHTDDERKALTGRRGRDRVKRLALMSLLRVPL